MVEGGGADDALLRRGAPDLDYQLREPQQVEAGGFGPNPSCCLSAMKGHLLLGQSSRRPVPHGGRHAGSEDRGNRTEAQMSSTAANRCARPSFPASLVSPCSSQAESGTSPCMPRGPISVRGRTRMAALPPRQLQEGGSCLRLTHSPESTAQAQIHPSRSPLRSSRPRSFLLSRVGAAEAGGGEFKPCHGPAAPPIGAIPETRQATHP